MNKMKLVKSAAILVLSMATTLIFAQDKVVPYSQIPSKIKNYVTTHFPKHSVIQSEIDTEGLGFYKQYEINLSDEIELKFNNKNRIIAIYGKSKLPDSVIPKKIWKYIATNYPNNAIIDWEIDGKNQQISLDNDLELEFNMNGDFVKIDN
jgi:hypothetical protein